MALFVATHGDERIGLEVAAELKKDGLDKYFDIIVANPRALKKGIRFTERDLNRSYPGNIRSPYYEERQAARNLAIARRYRYIIDLHEASSGTDNFIIISKKKLPKKFPVSALALSRVLLWPLPKGPLGGIVENEVELEFGTKNRERKDIVREATQVVEKFIQTVILNKGESINFYQEIFFVYGKLLINDCPKNIKVSSDFCPTAINGESFLPLLTGQYKDLGILCYKMRVIKNYPCS